MSDLMDLKRVMEDLETREMDEKKEEHIHEEGIQGATSLGQCSILNVAYRNQMPLPKIEGIKADKGALIRGDALHNETQDKAIAHYRKFPLNGISVDKEIMLKEKITEKTTVESPVDLGFVEGKIIQEPWHFRNTIVPKNTLAPGAKLKKIYDIKSQGNYAFYHHQKELPFNWLAQFHFYMKAANLPELTTYLLDKNRNQKVDVVVKWDGNVWQKVIEKTKREEELIEKTKGLEEIPVDLVKESDLPYLTEERPICWYSCPYSQTHEEQLDSGEVKLKLDKPCKYAMKFLREQAIVKFNVDDKWQRGSSHVTIEEINLETDMVYSINKKNIDLRSKGKPFEIFSDTLYSALMLFTPIEAKEK